MVASLLENNKLDIYYQHESVIELYLYRTVFYFHKKQTAGWFIICIAKDTV